jgi:hypothetical protein
MMMAKHTLDELLSDEGENYEAQATFARGPSKR